MATWCNGNTQDFGSCIPRPNRGVATNRADAAKTQKSNRGPERCEMRKAQTYPRGEKVAARHSKCRPVRGPGSSPGGGTKSVRAEMLEEQQDSDDGTTVANRFFNGPGRFPGT